MNRPRLLVVTPDFPPQLGGIQLLLARLVTRLDTFETVVATRGLAQTYSPISATGNARVRIGPPANGKLSLAALNFRAATYGIRWRPAVVLCAHVVVFPAAAIVAHACGARMVTYLYADELPAHPGFTRLALRRSAAAIAISRYTRDVALQLGGNPATMHLIPPGVDPPRVSSVAKRLRPTIITVARLTDRYKGHDVVLRAMPTIRAEVPGVEWLVVGDGPLRPELERSARELGVDDVVTFCGTVSDDQRDRLLAASDVFVMPSRLPSGGAGGEGFGIVYLEAAQHGVPSVAGNAAGAVDAILDGQTGVLVDPRSHADVAQALIGLLKAPESAARMGADARQRAATFTWDRMAHEVQRVLLG